MCKLISNISSLILVFVLFSCSTSINEDSILGSWEGTSENNFSLVIDKNNFKASDADESAKYSVKAIDPDRKAIFLELVEKNNNIIPLLFTVSNDTLFIRTYMGETKEPVTLVKKSK